MDENYNGNHVSEDTTSTSYNDTDLTLAETMTNRTKMETIYTCTSVKITVFSLDEGPRNASQGRPCMTSDAGE